MLVCEGYGCEYVLCVVCGVHIWWGVRPGVGAVVVLLVVVVLGSRLL